MNDGDHYQLELPSGPVRVRGIYFELTVKVETLSIPIFGMKQYRALDQEAPITQVVSFGPVTIDGSDRVVEFHHMQDATHVIMRKR